ncbi:hypothetical protein CVT24_003266 [Panaeolus cyanescens]|uniref:F-box domain-containing protein n=1 Tax=Panaeolus cyanescens TaxID=181874 RepID=A0A409X206_9AGAR|nr:hypothetical protein CVT24_003266 [Panaeolus cyanescens]
MALSKTSASHIVPEPIFPLELFKEAIDHLAASLTEQNELKATMKPLCLVSKGFLSICRHYVFQEINIGFIDKSRRSSIRRLKNLAKLLDDQPLLARRVQALNGSIFSNPTHTGNSLRVKIPNGNTPLTPFFNLPNVRSMTISQNKGAMHLFNYSSTSQADPSFYGRDALLRSYIAHGSLTKLVLHDLKDIHIITILSSPTLTSLILKECSIQEISEVPSENNLSSDGFNLIEYHSIKTTDNSLFILSLCPNLQRLYFDSRSEFQSNSELVRPPVLDEKGVECLPFSKLTEAEFGAWDLSDVDWYSFYLTAENKGTLAFPELKGVTFSVVNGYQEDPASNDNRGWLHEVDTLFKHMPVLTRLHLSGISVRYLKLEQCVFACRHTLKTLLIDWEFFHRQSESDEGPYHGYGVESFSKIILLALESAQLKIDLGMVSFETLKSKLHLEQFQMLRDAFVVNGAQNFPSLKALKVDVLLSVEPEEDENGLDVMKCGMERAVGSLDMEGEGKHPGIQKSDAGREVEQEAQPEVEKRSDSDAKGLGKGQTNDDGKDSGIRRETKVKTIYDEAVHSIGKEAQFVFEYEVNMVQRTFECLYERPADVITLSDVQAPI